MAGIISNVTGDIQRLRELKAAIEDVKKSLKGIDIRVRLDIKESVEAQLKTLSEQYTALVMKIAEAEGKIKLSVHNINKASDAIIQAQEKMSKVTGTTTQQSSATVAPSNTSAETANIQAQAKAYADLKVEINDVLGTRDANVKRMVDEMNAIRLINAEIKVLTKTQGELGTLSSAQQKRLEQLNNSLLTHKTALSDVRQVLSNNAKMDNAAATSMDALGQSLSRMRIAYRGLTEEERKSPFGKELLASINQADARIKELDVTIGNHQRTVGNYASGWNGLGMSVQQIVRELPSAKMGLNMFFLAISNNLPILVDEINRAKAANEALKASGQSSTPVWKQVTSSLFSWQSAMMVGITLLTMYGKDIANWVGSLFNAKDALKETKRFQDALNQSMRDAVKDSSEETTKLNILYRAATNAKKSIEERAFSVRELKKEFPSYFGLMDDEKIKAGEAANAYKLLTENILASAKARRTEKLIINEQNKYLDYLGETAMALISVQKAQEKLNQSEAIYNKEKTKENKEIYEIDKRSLERRKEEYNKASNKSLQQKINVDNLVKTVSASNLYGDPKKRKEESIKNKDYWQQQRQIADVALNQIDSSQRRLMAAGNFEGIDSTVVKSYKDNVKKLKEAEKELKIYDSTSKQEKAAEKLRKEQEKLNLLLDKQSREQKRMKEESANEIKQLEIDRLKEGSDKVLEQRKLNHKKELEAIERETQEKKTKAIEEGRAAHEANPDEKKKPFNVEEFIKSEPVKKQFAIFDNVADEKTKTSKTQYNRGDDLSGLLNEYQDYTDKRLAIETKFNNDLAVLEEQRKQAVKNGDTQQVEQIDRAKAQATTNKGKELMGLDYDKLKESPEYVRAFENLKETSSETLNSLLSQLENAKTAAAKVLSPDQLREYTTTIQEIMNELDERNPFQALSDKKQELADAEQELADAQIALENARQAAETVKGGGKVEYTTTKFNQKTGKIDSTKAYLTEAQALENVKTKTDNYNKSKDNAVKASTKVRKSEKEVRDIIDDLSKSISDVGNSIGGPAGEIISLIGNIGSFAMMAMSGVETASKTTSTAIQTVEKASVILMIISAAIQIATKMLDLFGGDDTTEKYESTKEVYESYINILDQVIDKQLEMAESLSGASAQAAYDKAIELVKTQSEAARVLGKQYLNSGASWKSHSKGYEEVEDMSSAGWADAAKALGMSVDQIKNTLGGRMGGLFDLTDEQLAKLQGEAHIFWAQLDDDTKDYANQIVEGVAQVGEILEQQITDATGVSFDSLVDNFKSALSDMDSSAEDFAEDFEQYMMNAIINSFINGDEFKKKLKDWHNKFAEYSKSNNEIDANEKEKLKEDWDIIVQEGVDYRNGVMEAMGFDSSDSSTSQDSTNGGFQSMSQDTGNELNGRFTALQISGEEIKNQNILQSQSLNLLTVKADAILTVNTETRNIADEIRTIQVNSYLELQAIRENTGMSAKSLKAMESKLDKIESNTRALSSK